MKAKFFTAMIFSVLFMMMVPALSNSQMSYPTHPIQIYIGQPPGGSTDILTRALAEQAKGYLGQEIVAVNKPGAAGTVSASQVAAAKPDGYILGTNPTAAFTIGPFMQELSVDLVEETTPILTFAKYYGGIFVKADSPFKSLKDFFDFARTNPGKATYGHPGVGTRAHMIMEMIAAQEGLKLNFVAFRGDAPEVSALLGGHILAAGASAGTIWTSQVEAGELRFLAVEEPTPSYPNVPALGDLGYHYSIPIFVFMFGPKNLPKPITQKLEDAFRKASESPAFIELAKKNTVYSEKNLFGAELASFLRSEKTKTGEFIKEAGLGKK